MKTVTVQAGATIDLGYQYDNYATEVIFPAEIIEPITDAFGSTGTFAIWYRRSGDSLGYPIGSPLVTFDSANDEVTWNIVESDTASPGNSQIQLRYIVDEVCVMSQVFAGNVSDSVDTGEEVPEPMEQWADAIVSAGAGGQPKVATSVSAMSDHNTIYLYTGSESGYIYGHIYYWNGSAWTDGGAYGGGSSSGTGLTDDIKQALLDCFDHVAWTDEHGQDYVDALEAALYPPANLLSISAVYTQSGAVYDTASLDDLKPDLVVTAHYDDGTSEAVTNYTLSGTLAVGTSTVTVSYGGKTTTFDVTVTEYPSYSITYNLTNVTSSNDAIKVAQGGSYTTMLSYDDTQYVLQSLAVTMGGTDVTSTVYSSGQILIQSVTGAVVITAVAGEPIINATALKVAGAALAWYSDNGTTRLANKYYAKYGCTTETCIADSTAEIKITNNTDAAIPAQEYYVGQASDFSNRQNVVANYAVSKGTTALAVGETLTFTYDIKRGNRLLFSAFENATISVRNVVVGEYVPDDADGSAYEVVAQNVGGNCYYYSDAGETQLSGSYENNHIKTSHSFDTDTNLIIVFDGPANAEGVFGSQHDTNHIYYCTNTGVSYWMGTDGFCVREMTVKAGCPFAIRVTASADNLNCIKVYKKKSA